MELALMKCEACRPGAPAMSRAEIQKWLKQLDGWDVVDRDGMETLKKVYSFRDFADALAFTIRIGEIAEEEDHHPEIITDWGRVTVSWWTHAVKGVHRNDLIMAAKTDEVLDPDVIPELEELEDLDAD